MLLNDLPKFVEVFLFQKCLICCVSECSQQTTLIATTVTTQKPLIGYFSYLETRKNNTYLLISNVLSIIVTVSYENLNVWAVHFVHDFEF